MKIKTEIWNTQEKLTTTLESTATTLIGFSTIGAFGLILNTQALTWFVLIAFTIYGTLIHISKHKHNKQKENKCKN